MIIEFTEGLIGLAVTAGLGVYTPSAAYGPNDVAITIRSVPQAPDNLIVFSPRPAVDNADSAESVLAMMIRTRCGPDPAVGQARDDAIFNLYESLTGVVLGGVPLAGMWRQSSTLVGQDANQRWESYSTYYCRISWQTLHRID